MLNIDPDFRAEMANAIDQREQPDPAAEEARMLEQASPILERLQKLASEAVSLRAPIEKRWLRNLRQLAGLREGETTTKDGVRQSPSTALAEGSTIFVNITRAKTNRTESKLFDILFPADDKNWGIQPTPVPTLETVARVGMDEAEKAAAQASQLEAGQLEMPGVTPDELAQKASDLGQQAAEANAQIEDAKRACQAMEREIDDQLTECRYPRKARDAISWACKLGPGIIKGPVVKDVSRKGWKQEGGAWSLAMGQEINRPGADVVNPWAFFPDPSATCMEDCEYTFERHLPSKTALRKLAKKLRFNPVAVKELLEEGPGEGATQDLTHLQDMRNLTGETAPVRGRYVLWEYHGPLEMNEIELMIRASGAPDAEQRAELFLRQGESLDGKRVIIHFCNGKLLKIAEYYPMDSDALIYSVFSLEKGDASVLGAIGIPEIMADSQEALNAAWRMMMDNSALSVGPQILVDIAAVKPADGDWKMKPRKVWQFDSAQYGSNNQQTPFQVFNVPVNQEQIAGIISLSMTFIDEETAMPRIAEGNGTVDDAAGATNTVGGLAMLMNAAGGNIRRMVKNYDDDVTAPLIERIYDWNMQYSEKQEIKGDMNVEARGTATLLERETRAQSFAVISQQWTVHPVIAPMLKAYEMISMTLQSLNINPSDVLITREDYEKKIKALAEQSDQPEDPQWAIRLQIAQIDAETRLQVASMERETEIMRLSQARDISIAEIYAALDQARLKTDSEERKLAAEIGADRQAAAEATSRGEAPPNSGGSVNFGAGKPA